MKNNIYIIGAGAVGKSLSVFLSLAGKNVSLVRGSVDGQPSRTEELRIVLQDDRELSAEIEVSTLSDHPQLDGLIVLTNKSFGNLNLSLALKGKTGHSPLVLLQNGLGVEQPFLDGNFPEIYRCVLFMTGQIMPENKVRFKPVAVCPIGIIKGGPDNLNRVVGELNNPHLSFQTEADIQTVIWKKAIINSVFNSICPLLEVDNGIFHRDEKVLEMAERVIKECIIIAREKGVHLETAEVVERLLLISKSSDGQLISTYQDILNKRPTEIKTLNFAIVEMAEKLNLEDQVKETNLLGELTRLKSEFTLRS